MRRRVTACVRYDAGSCRTLAVSPVTRIVLASVKGRDEEVATRGSESGIAEKAKPRIHAGLVLEESYSE